MGFIGGVEMAFVKVNYLNKEYSISDQIPVFVQLQKQFGGYNDHLMHQLLDQMKKNSFTGVSDEGFDYWDKPIRSIAKEIIKCAGNNGIYDLTENDLVDNNEGYKNLKIVCNETFRKIALETIESKLDALNEYNEAYKDAASTVTGSGVSIWTNSLVDALVFNAMEGNVIRKQAKQADRQLNEAIISIQLKTDSRQFKYQENIKKNYYYPECEKSIQLIISYMFSMYLDKLDAIGGIICSELKVYNLQQSSEILKNVEILNEDFIWLDTGTHDSVLNASNFVQKIEHSSGEKVACLEEISLKNGWISPEIILKNTEDYKNNNYYDYIRNVISKMMQNV